MRIAKQSRMLGLLLLSLAPWSVAETAPNIGWHGETMPGGLVRGEVEGDYIWPKDGAVMVYVPPGGFTMGSEEGERDEKPVREIWLDAFYIDKYEVSWGQWKLSKLPYSEEPSSRLRQPRAPDWGIVDGQPMLNVSWHDTQEWLGWAGKRLPTEAEWEKAARGTDGRRYPWGNSPPNFDRAVWLEHPIAVESTADVTCCTGGASPYGALNLAGNVYEWCEDTYAKDFYRNSPTRNPVNRAEGDYRVLRGGAYVLEVEDLRSAYRYRLRPEDRTPYIGFRSVISVQVP
jgi:formylglycine-generating enzyme required for sulfatase activity